MPLPPHDFDIYGWSRTDRMRFIRGWFGWRVERLWINEDGSAKWRRTSETIEWDRWALSQPPKAEDAA